MSITFFNNNRVLTSEALPSKGASGSPAKGGERNTLAAQKCYFTKTSFLKTNAANPCHWLKNFRSRNPKNDKHATSMEFGVVESPSLMIFKNVRFRWALKVSIVETLSHSDFSRVTLKHILTLCRTILKGLSPPNAPKKYCPSPWILQCSTHLSFCFCCLWCQTCGDCWTTAHYRKNKALGSKELLRCDGFGMVCVEGKNVWHHTLFLLKACAGSRNGENEKMRREVNSWRSER